MKKYGISVCVRQMICWGCEICNKEHAYEDYDYDGDLYCDNCKSVFEYQDETMINGKNIYILKKNNVE